MQCTAQTKSGKPCKSDAIRGGTVCRMHGGGSPKVQAKAAVRAEVERWGLSGKQAVDDPGETLLRLVTALRVKVERIGDAIQAKIDQGRELYGDEFTLESVLIGDTFVATQFETKKSGEYIRGLVKLEADAQNDLINASAKAIAAGLAERQVRLAERQGELLYAVMLAIATDPVLALTPAQRKAMPDVIDLHVARAVAGE